MCLRGWEMKEWGRGDDGGMWGVNRRVMLIATVICLIENAFGGERKRMAIHL